MLRSNKISSIGDDKVRIGIGYDVHRLVKGRKLIIGGIEIPYELGLDGHSDADVLLHAIMDSVLGALALGDIGKFFPDTDQNFKDIDSKILMKEVAKYVDEMGYKISNIDSVIIAQKPKMAPHIDHMREIVASIFKVDIRDIGIKATTTEKLGFEGREEGISAQSVALLVKK